MQEVRVIQLQGELHKLKRRIDATSWTFPRAGTGDVLDRLDRLNSLQAWPQHTHCRAASSAAQGVAGGLQIVTGDF